MGKSNPSVITEIIMILQKGCISTPSCQRCIIDNMLNSLFWTTLDAASAYWTIQVSEPDKEKMAFPVKRGKFEVNVMPYGLCNSGTSCRHLIDMKHLFYPRIKFEHMDHLVIFTRHLRSTWCGS